MGNEPSHPVPNRLPLSARSSVLSGYPSLEAIAKNIKNGNTRRIIVMTGAGLSVAAGIPDFRSEGTVERPAGLYSQLGDLGLPCPEAVFHINYFQSNPQPFYKLCKQLFPGNYVPTRAHFFSVLLHQKNLLLRHYTQNIDNLELLAGVPSEKLIEAHGSFSDVHCIRCRKQYPIGWFREQIYGEKDVERCHNAIAINNEDDGVFVPEYIPFNSESSSLSDIETKRGNDEFESHCGGGEGDSSPQQACHRNVSDMDSPNEILTESLADLTLDESLGCPLDVRNLSKESTETSSNLSLHSADKKKYFTEPFPSDNNDQLFIHHTHSRVISPSVDQQKDDIPLLSSNHLQKFNQLYKRCNGLIKPDITFFGESLPKRFSMLSTVDLPEADLLIVMGTSLQVYPFAGLISMVSPFCPRLLINKEVVGLSRNGGEDGSFLFFEEDNYRDVLFEGECDEGIITLCRLLDWEQELENLVNDYHSNTEDRWRRLEEHQLIETDCTS